MNIRSSKPLSGTRGLFQGLETAVSAFSKAWKNIAAATFFLALDVSATEARPIAVELQQPSDADQQRALAVFKRIVKERTGLEVIQAHQAPITFGFRKDIGTEGFSIENGAKGALEVRGNGMPGLMAGIGKFLRTARMETGVFQPGAWRGVSVPTMPVRGIYFATHFFNWYHVAPVEDIRRYEEELALWGCNSIAVWFDMHHFQGLDDPEAQKMMERLRVILQGAQDVGIKPALTVLANEGYDSSPVSIRAEWALQNGCYRNLSHYHREVCPNKPGGMEYILSTRHAMLKAFAGIDFKYIFLWPHDQGGCTCAECAPWGARGFMKVSEALAKQAKELFPDVKIVLSTWWFDHCFKGDVEWPGFYKVMAEQKPGWIDYLMADSGENFPPYLLKHGSPNNLPILNFPEISMFKSDPWGGYGANPAPQRMKEIWSPIIDKISGGFPYSEGIFEDINKCIALQLYWSKQDPTQTVREYVAYEFSPAGADDLCAVAVEMEKNFSHYCLRWVRGHDMRENLEKKLYPANHELAEVLYKTPNLKGAQSRFERVKQAEAKLDAQVKNSWRWKIFYLRAGIDAALEESGGRPSDALDSYFEELNKIYHADNAIYSVHPPDRKMLLKWFGTVKPEPKKEKK